MPSFGAIVKVLWEKNPEIPVELRPELERDLLLYGELYVEKRDGAYYRLDPLKVATEIKDGKIAYLHIAQ